MCYHYVALLHLLRPQTSIESRCLFPCLVAFLLSVAGCSTSSAPDEATIKDALLTKIQSGMTRTEVEAILGTGGLPNEMEQKVLDLAMAKPSDPSKAPDGFQPEDAFCYYTVDSIKVFLQFRDDKLINFNTEIYQDLLN